MTIEPIYKNIYVKSNMNGEFIIINPYLVADLKALGLWDFEMIGQLKYQRWISKGYSASACAFEG
jgi:ribonucleoside-diphosphate reductase alpha chain